MQIGFRDGNFRLILKLYRELAAILKCLFPRSAVFYNHIFPSGREVIFCSSFIIKDYGLNNYS